MKKKQLLAFTLAGSMVFASISWADVGALRQGNAGSQKEDSWNFGEEKASPSQAKEKATLSNAFFKAEEEASFELSAVDGKESAGCFDKLEILVNGVLPDKQNYVLYGKDPSGREKRITGFSYYSAGSVFSRTVDVSSAYSSRTLGEYEFYVTDSDGKVVGNILKIQVVKQPKLKLEFIKQVLTKRYGYPEPESFSYVGSYSVQAFDPESGEPLSAVSLKNLRFERQPGEEPGKYPITKLSSDEVEEIELVPGEFSCFEISKGTRYLNSNSVNVRLTGSEQMIDITELHHLKDQEIPTKVILGALAEEDQTYFSELPVVDGMNIKFTLKQLEDSYTFDIPFTMESNYYTYEQDSSDQIKITVNATRQKTVETRTEEEIRTFYSEHPFNPSQSDRWTETPNAYAENPGKLSEESLQNALNTLNFMRFIAGIHSDVTINEEYQAYAQAGTTLLIRAGSMDHTPKQPEGVSDEFYKLGYKGTSSSNLGWGYPNLSNALINGWMDDGDASNIDRVGHRRWCLDPNMTQTGFGHSGTYTAMYAFDDINQVNDHDYDFIPWPAQTMPLDYFQGPWMVSLNTERYSVKSADEDNIKVTLTSKNTGKTYTLDSSNKSKSGKYFNLSTGGYGYGPAVIFEPKVSFSSGDQVTVQITGLKDRYGSPETIEYTVKFFRMSSGGSSSGGSGGGSSSGGGGGGGSSSGGGGGGGSSSGGGGGGGSTAGGPGSAKTGITGKTASLPDYVVKGSWTTGADGSWKFADAAGSVYTNKWAAVENPYANTALGQQAYDWFFFDASGNMLTGWHVEGDGNKYYLNPDSDGTRGRMVTGWTWITDQNGVKKCYYFNPNSDGFRGKMMTSTVIDGKTVNANGEWVVNGVVQTQ